MPKDMTGNWWLASWRWDSIDLRSVLANKFVQLRGELSLPVVIAGANGTECEFEAAIIGDAVL